MRPFSLFSEAELPSEGGESPRKSDVTSDTPKFEAPFVSDENGSSDQSENTDVSPDLRAFCSADNAEALYERLRATFPAVEEKLRGSCSREEEDRILLLFLLQAAEAAASLGEIPVAALLVNDEGRILDIAVNERENARNPLAHAETSLLQRVCRHQNSWRLENCRLYVTLEPCMMCTAALRQARVGEVVYAALDPKAGCIESRARLLELDLPGHRCRSRRAAELAPLAADQLTRFFRALRRRNQDLRRKLGSSFLRKEKAKSGEKELKLDEFSELK